MALDIGGVLTKRVGPVPVWAIVLGGGIALAFVAPKLLARFTGSPGTSSSTAPVTPPDPNLDPNTGVPYSVENAVNPATGLPNYNTLFPSVPPTSTAPPQPTTPTSPPGVPGPPNYVGPPAPYVGPPTPTPTPTPAVPTQAQIADAINGWQQHTGLRWLGPPGSFPAGWGQVPNGPGAGDVKNGVFHYTTPPLVGTGPSRPVYSQPWPTEMRRIY